MEEDDVPILIPPTLLQHTANTTSDCLDLAPYF